MTAAKLKKGILVVLKYFTLILGAFVSILPLVVCVITAFKSPEEYASTSVMTLPKSWTYVENFIQGMETGKHGCCFQKLFYHSGICTGRFYPDRLYDRICTEPF